MENCSLYRVHIAASSDYHDCLFAGCLGRANISFCGKHCKADMSVFADCLGFDDDMALLDESIEEEGAADETITRIATGGLFRSGVNEAALH